MVSAALSANLTEQMIGSEVFRVPPAMTQAILGPMGHERIGTRRMTAVAGSGAPKSVAALADAAATHRQATSLLEALCAEQARFEERLTTSRPDPVTARAGRGALEGAIRRTRSIVASLDRLLRSGAGQPSARG